MRGYRPTAALVLFAALAAAGCQGISPGRRVARAEPPLVDAPGAEAGTGVIEATPARPVTVVDRHPLLSKPRQYYESSGKNKLVKATAATVIGIPAGIFGEIRQIVRGQPQGVPTY